MTAPDTHELAALIHRERDALLTRWRQQVRKLPSAARLDTPTLNDHIPTLLEELVTALRERSPRTIPEALNEGSPPAHGSQRLNNGFDITEVVAEYNILRGCIHDLADEHGIEMQGEPFHIVNRLLDGAIGAAVQSFADEKALEVRRRREEYLAFVAHDLRTPLNALSLAARVLERIPPENAAGPEASRMRKSLRRNVQRLADLVDKVLEENASLRTENGIALQPRTFDLWPLVESVTQDLHPVAASAGARIVNEVPDDGMVYADAGLLRRILENLVTNALRYTPKGEVVIGSQEPTAGGPVECWVKDNGAGIPAPLLERVFEKGETDPGAEDRPGLGLAIVKTFVEAHGGTITVESQPGSGSTFRFSLPGRAGA